MWSEENLSIWDLKDFSFMVGLAKMGLDVRWTVVFNIYMPNNWHVNENLNFTTACGTNSNEAPDLWQWLWTCRFFKICRPNQHYNFWFITTPLIHLLLEKNSSAAFPFFLNLYSCSLHVSFEMALVQVQKLLPQSMVLPSLYCQEL